MSTRRFLLTVFLVIALLAPGASQSLAQPAASQTAATPSTSGGSMLIVENAGQWPESARFQVWNLPLSAGTTWLAEDAVWLVFAGGKSQVADPEASAGPLSQLRPANRQPATLHALKLTFPGSNPDVRLEPFEPLDTVVSYFIGNDPDQWRPAAPVWGGVRYVDLYPGIDLVLGGQDGAWRLEAESGAAVEQVRVHVEGTSIVTLHGAMLSLEAIDQSLSIRLPSALFNYHVSGLAQQGDLVTMTVYPSARIPSDATPNDNPGDLLYSTLLGGSSYDVGQAIAVDASGNAYVTGNTNANDFPTTPGAFDPIHNGDSDAFVVKLNPTGSGLAYATFLGGTLNEFGSAIAVNESGNAYIAGSTNSDDFPATLNAFDPSFNDGDCSGSPCLDTFVAKLNPSGSALVYATYLGGNQRDTGAAVALDGTGSAFVTGSTYSPDFPVTPGAFDASYNGFSDTFVAKLNPAGADLIFATFLGGSNDDVGTAIAVDQTSNAYVTGYTLSSDLPTTPGAFDPSYNGSHYDAFVVRLNEAGSGLDYATFLGGSGDYDFSSAIAVDGTGSAYVTGSTNSDNFPTTLGAFDPSLDGFTDAFVVELNPAGSELDYGTYLGGGSGEEGVAIAVDGAGNAYVTGTTSSSDFPVTPDGFDTSFNEGATDCFVAKLNSAGSALVYGTFLGGSGFNPEDSEQGSGIATDDAGKVFVTGRTWSDDFPTTPGAFDTTYNGGSCYGWPCPDAFVTQLNMGSPTSITFAELTAIAAAETALFPTWLVAVFAALVILASLAHIRPSRRIG